jgi:hypothetical protein
MYYMVSCTIDRSNVEKDRHLLPRVAPPLKRKKLEAMVRHKVCGTAIGREKSSMHPKVALADDPKMAR